MIQLYEVLPRLDPYLAIIIKKSVRVWYPLKSPAVFNYRELGTHWYWM